MDKNANAHIRRLMSDLRHSLSKVFTESTEVNRVLHRIRDQGWSLYLVIDKSQSGIDPSAVELPAEGAPTEADPKFRIDGRDLTFLRSVGIDPTRTLRRRRRKK
jgi:hypothetical protein